MRNTLNEQTKKFIQKIRPILRDLYNEYVSIDDDGVHYTCPLTELMDNCSYVADLNIEDVVNEEL